MWQSILDDALRARARTMLAELARDLAAVRSSDPSLVGGAAGHALLFGTLASIDDRYSDTAFELLEHANANLDAAMAPSLFAGFPGIAWAGEHLRKLHDNRDDAINEDVDDTLVEWLEAGSPAGFDLHNGVIGVGVYALERVARPSGQRCLELVIERLEHYVRPDREGLGLWTPPAYVGPEAAAVWPHGYWDYGMAHGAAGAIAFLASCTQTEVASRAAVLLDGLVPWLIARRRHDSPRYPAAEAPDRPDRPGRVTGWCYGDASIALAILRAARARDRRDWESNALELARRSLADPASVDDAAVCHGIAGVAHLYGRLAEQVDDPAMRDAARAWLARALELGPPRGTTLLDGPSGFGLVLLAASDARDVTSSWDRMLLLR